MSNVKIVSAGDIRNTHVYVDDIEVQGVMRIDWELDVNGWPRAQIYVDSPQVEFDLDESNVQWMKAMRVR